MKQFTTIFFMIVAVALIWLFFNKEMFSENNQEEQIQPKIVTPQMSANVTNIGYSSESFVFDENALLSLVPLAADETFIQSIISDINSDSFDDQISLIRKTGVTTLHLLLVLYNPHKKVYERVYTIDVEAVPLRSFSFYVQDITGEKINALIYTGFDADNLSVFCAFLPQYSIAGAFSYVPIVNLKADGTIFLEEIVRSDSYTTNESNRAESFPIWVYAADPDSNPNTLDQIHTRYDWNATERIYTQTSRIRVQGSKIEAKELAKILDGNVKTFEAFLNGLWYKPSSVGDTEYLFFDLLSDTQNREIVFLRGTTQEIYRWNSSTLRRNGIYLATSNKSITTLKRRFDITLSASDEIKLKLAEDVQMKIAEESVWDGVYKKMPSSRSFRSPVTSENSYTQLAQELQNNSQQWTSGDGSVLELGKEQYTITITSGNESVKTETGYYALATIGLDNVIQFRSNRSTGVLTQATETASYYKIDMQTSTLPNAAIHEVITFIPVKVSMYNIDFAGGKSFIFERTIAASLANKE